jgi:hypothetical protein
VVTSIPIALNPVATARHFGDSRLGLDIDHAQLAEIHVHRAHVAEKPVLSFEVLLLTDKVRFRAGH